MLPPSVARLLKAGTPVEPKLYNAASVLYTDIVNFTNMSSQSTPLQVITLLNGLYTQFDTIVNAHEAYKVLMHYLHVLCVQVETVGDCYVIVSGLPNEIRNHAEEMADIAMGIIKAVDGTKVSHMPADYKLKMRVGVHSGPVATGVIGLNAPRYCLFGDTV
jgi:class 3 adenylate cyclase